MWDICSILKLDKRQQVRVFALAGYPLPAWVEELLSTPPTPIVDEAGLAFDPSLIGRYVGESQEQHATAEGSKPIPGAENIERFAIERVQGWVRITGRSFHKTTEKRVSTWHGRLWKVENGNILSFAIELDTDSRELCTLLITCQNGEAEGWFYSGRDYRRFIYEFWAKKSRFGLTLSIMLGVWHLFSLGIYATLAVTASAESVYNKESKA